MMKNDNRGKGKSYFKIMQILESKNRGRKYAEHCLHCYRIIQDVGVADVVRRNPKLKIN